MGSRGPKPLPANVHRLKGNPSKLPVGDLGDSVDPVIELPGAPSWLWKEARKEWRRIGALLVENRLVSKLDRSALSLYCQWWAKWVWAEEQLTRAMRIAETRRQAHIDAAIKRAVEAARNAGAQAPDSATNGAAPSSVTTPDAPAPDLDAIAAAAAIEAEASWTGGDGLMIPTPNGGVMYSPHWVASRQAALYVDKFLASFGLSPSSRGRVSPSNNRQGSLPFGDGDSGAAPGGFSGI